jgi:hypothetical protein
MIKLIIDLYYAEVEAFLSLNLNDLDKEEELFRQWHKRAAILMTRSQESLVLEA